MGRAVADHRLHADEAGAGQLRLGGEEGAVDPLAIAAAHRLDLPAVGLEALGDVLAGEAHRGLAVDGDAVVVVEVDEPAQLEVAGQAGRLGGDALHEIAVGDDGVDEVVGHRVARPEPGGEHGLAQREAHAVGEALAERTGGALHAGEHPELRVARGAGVELAKLLQVVERAVEAGQVEQRVEQHRAVAGGQDEPVAAQPARLVGIEAQVARPQHVGHVRGAHGHAGVAALRLLHAVGGQHADGVDRLLDELGGCGGQGDGPRSGSADILDDGRAAGDANGAHVNVNFGRKGRMRQAGSGRRGAAGPEGPGGSADRPTRALVCPCPRLLPCRGDPGAAHHHRRQRLQPPGETSSTATAMPSASQGPRWPAPPARP